MRKSFLSAVWMILAGMLFCMPVSVVGKEKNDTLILNRIYEYLKANRSEFKPLVDNVGDRADAECVDQLLGCFSRKSIDIHCIA